jgi:hypothetical protein
MRSLFALVLGISTIVCAAWIPASAQASKPQTAPESSIPQYTIEQSKNARTKADSSNAPFRFVPFIVQDEDKFQSYIQNDALSVWVNVPSLQKNGDTITAIVKRVMRYDLAHTLNKDLVYVDVMKFNTRNDTFARFASLDNKTGSLAPNTKPEWEKTALDLDITALYHFIGFLHTEKLKK